MDISPNVILSGLGMLVAAASGYGGAAQRLRTTESKIAHTEKMIDELERELDEHKTDTTDRLARIETKLDFIVDRVAT